MTIEYQQTMSFDKHTRKTKYASGRTFGDRCMSQVKKIVEKHVHQYVSPAAHAVESTCEVDRTQATDLHVVFSQPRCNVAVRMRDLTYWQRFRGEFTIRAPHELQKMTQQGFADFLFYGFQQNEKVVYWRLADLAVFRSEYWQAKNQKRKIGSSIDNKGDHTQFVAYRWQDFSEHFVIAEHWDER